MNEFTITNFGSTVKSLREKKNIRQEDAASALGIATNYLSKVETDKQILSLHNMAAFASLCGITLDYFVGMVEPEYKETSLNNEMKRMIRCLSEKQKTALLETMLIWMSEMCSVENQAEGKTYDHINCNRKS